MAPCRLQIGSLVLQLKKGEVGQERGGEGDEGAKPGRDSPHALRHMFEMGKVNFQHQGIVSNRGRARMVSETYTHILVR